tara:strand:- start:3548 stop:3718 length:171 start_codon:yes stop_codon:yes gene_type:complete
MVPKATPSLTGDTLYCSSKYIIGIRKNHERKKRSKFKKGRTKRVIEIIIRDTSFIY